MKAVSTIIGLLLSIAISQNAIASSAECQKQYEAVFRLAAENTWNAKDARVGQYQVALKSRKLNGIWAANYIDGIRQEANYYLNGLTQDQATLSNILVKSEDCFPGMSREAISNISQMLAK